MKKDLTFFIFFAVITAVILYPWLFGGRIFSNLDTAFLFYPFFDFYHNAIINGESFLWNPLLFSGFPTYLSQSGGFLDPVNRLIFSFFDGVNGLHLRLYLDYFLVLVFSYLAGRSFGISSIASSMIGMAYLSSIYIIYISNPITANTLFLPPFLLWVFKKSLEGALTRRILWAILGGIGLGWVWLSGNAQLTVYILSLFALFIAIYFFLMWEGKKDFRSAVIFAGIISVIIIVGVIVGLPQILASAKHTPLTVRAAGLPYEITAGRNIGPWDFILFLFPSYLYFPYLSEGKYALYIGAFMFFTALSAVAIVSAKFKLFFRGALGGDENRKIKKIILFASVVLFAFIAAFWKSPISYILQHLPVFKLFRYIDRWMLIGTFYLAALGALGFDLIKECGREKILKNIFNILGLIIGFISAFVLALNFFGEKFWSIVSSLFYSFFSNFFYGRFGFNKDLGHYQEAINRGIAAWRDFLSLESFTFLPPFLALIIAFLLVYLFLRERVSWLNFRRIGFLLSVATFIFAFAAYWPSNALPKSAINSYDVLLQKYIPNQDRISGRAFPFMLQQKFAEFVKPGYKAGAEEELALAELELASGRPDMNFFSGMASVDGYDPFVPRRLREVLEEIGSTNAGQDANKKLSNAEITSRLVGNLDALGMMSGKYIISGFKLESQDLKFLGEETVSRLDISLYIYENLKAMPRFYYPKKTVNAPGSSLLSLLKENKKNFHEETYLDCRNCAKEEAVLESGAPKLIAFKNGFIELESQTPQERWLIISESYLPGWTAEIDGKTAKITLANGLYMALRVPAGEHIVAVSYNGVLGEASFLRRIGFMD